MKFFPVFLSIVLVVRNQSLALEQTIKQVQTEISDLVSDYDVPPNLSSG